MNEGSLEPINGLIYDCEIINCIPPSNGERDGQLWYCKGWTDYEGMGISCIGVYDLLKDQYRIFLEDNFRDFQHLVNGREHIIGFNSFFFDDKLCFANDIVVTTTYDLLAEVRIASGQPPVYTPGQTRGGYHLEALAQANLGYGKSGSGEQAPVLWQNGRYGAAIDYCLSDIQITKKLFDLRRSIKDPTNGKTLKLRDIYEQ